MGLLWKILISELELLEKKNWFSFQKYCQKVFLGPWVQGKIYPRPQGRKVLDHPASGSCSVTPKASLRHTNHILQLKESIARQ
jgi:hypothetical protein